MEVTCPICGEQHTVGSLTVGDWEMAMIQCPEMPKNRVLIGSPAVMPLDGDEEP